MSELNDRLSDLAYKRGHREFHEDRIHRWARDTTGGRGGQFAPKDAVGQIVHAVQAAVSGGKGKAAKPDLGPALTHVPSKAEIAARPAHLGKGFVRGEEVKPEDVKPGDVLIFRRGAVPESRVMYVHHIEDVPSDTGTEKRFFQKERDPNNRYDSGYRIFPTTHGYNNQTRKYDRPLAPNEIDKGHAWFRAHWDNTDYTEQIERHKRLPKLAASWDKDYAERQGYKFGGDTSHVQVGDRVVIYSRGKYRQGEVTKVTKGKIEMEYVTPQGSGVVTTIAANRNEVGVRAADSANPGRPTAPAAPTAPLPPTIPSPTPTPTPPPAPTSHTPVPSGNGGANFTPAPHASSPAGRAALTKRRPKGETWRDYSSGRRGHDWSTPTDPVSDDLDRGTRHAIAMKDTRDLGYQIVQPFDVETQEVLNEILWSYNEMFPGWPRMLKSVKVDINDNMTHPLGTILAWNRTYQGYGMKPNQSQLNFNPRIFQGTSVGYAGRELNKDKYGREAAAKYAQPDWFSLRWSEMGLPDGSTPDWEKALNGTLHHELGHTVGWATIQTEPYKSELYRYLESVGLGKEDPYADGGFRLDPAATQVMSRYGGTSLHEFMAEAWAEYIIDSEPRELSASVGNIMGRAMNAYLAQWNLNTPLEAKRMFIDGAEFKKFTPHGEDTIPGREVQNVNFWHLPKHTPIGGGKASKELIKAHAFNLNSPSLNGEDRGHIMRILGDHRGDARGTSHRLWDLRRSFQRSRADLAANNIHRKRNQPRIEQYRAAEEAIKGITDQLHGVHRSKLDDNVISHSQIGMRALDMHDMGHDESIDRAIESLRVEHPGAKVAFEDRAFARALKRGDNPVHDATLAKLSMAQLNDVAAQLGMHGALPKTKAQAIENIRAHVAGEPAPTRSAKLTPLREALMRDLSVRDGGKMGWSPSSAYTEADLAYMVRQGLIRRSSKEGRIKGGPRDKYVSLTPKGKQWLADNPVNYPTKTGPVGDIPSTSLSVPPAPPVISGERTSAHSPIRTEEQRLASLKRVRFADYHGESIDDATRAGLMREAVSLSKSSNPEIRREAQDVIDNWDAGTGFRIATRGGGSVDTRTGEFTPAATKAPKDLTETDLIGMMRDEEAKNPGGAWLPSLTSRLMSQSAEAGETLAHRKDLSRRIQAAHMRAFADEAPDHSAHRAEIARLVKGTLVAPAARDSLREADRFLDHNAPDLARERVKRALDHQVFKARGSLTGRYNAGLEALHALHQSLGGETPPSWPAPTASTLRQRLVDAGSDADRHDLISQHLQGMTLTDARKTATMLGVRGMGRSNHEQIAAATVKYFSTGTQQADDDYKERQGSFTSRVHRAGETQASNVAKVQKRRAAGVAAAYGGTAAPASDVQPELDWNRIFSRTPSSNRPYKASKAPKVAKDYTPAEGEPGAAIAWTHHHEGGGETQRTGRVWSLGPTDRHGVGTHWVIPDEKLPGDRYHAVLVQRESGGHRWEGAQKIKLPHSLHSYDTIMSETGSATESAARIAKQHRAASGIVDPEPERPAGHAPSLGGAAVNMVHGMDLREGDKVFVDDRWQRVGSVSKPDFRNKFIIRDSAGRRISEENVVGSSLRTVRADSEPTKHKDAGFELELKAVLPAVGREVKHRINDLTGSRLPFGLSRTEYKDGADEYKRTGAMIALLPSAGWAARLAQPGGEPASDLHITLGFLGKGADFSYAQRDALVEAMRGVAGKYGQMLLRAFSVNLFNPNSDKPCLVLGIGGPNLAEIKDDVWAAMNGLDLPTLPKQHTPWVPHVTLAYDPTASQVQAAKDLTGIVMFDRIGVFMGGDIRTVPLNTNSSSAPDPTDDDTEDE